jgi:amino acid transporter
VNTSFVQRVLGGRNPVGRHIRYLPPRQSGALADAAQPGPWYQIVGVVPDLGMSREPDPAVAGVYHAASPGTMAPPVDADVAPNGSVRVAPAPGRAVLHPAHMAVRVSGDAEVFAPRLRALAAALDPTLRLHDLQRMDRIGLPDIEFAAFWVRLLALTSSMALLVSLAGIYAVMAFTVARRTREIGIRLALGSNARRILATIFRRPLTQVAIGVVAGAWIVAILAFDIVGGGLSARGVAIVTGYATLMMIVCMLACVVPTRRVLGIEPTEAMRADA